MRIGLLCFILGLSFISCKNNTNPNGSGGSTLPFYNSTDYTPEWISPNDKTYTDIHTIGDFEFTDHHGKRFSNENLDGKIYVADFFFTSCPTICPKLTLSMERLQNKFIDDEDFQLISHTVMPWKDSVPVLNQYAENMEVNYEKWKLLTGDEDEIYTLARKSYFADEKFGFNDDETDFLHTDKFILVDKKRRIRGIYTGLIEEDILRLEEDINILLEE